MTIRDLIGERCVEMLADPPPARLRQILIEMTGLFYRCKAETREADLAYTAVLFACLQSDEAANRARIRAQTSPEYARKREADDTEKIVVHATQSIKATLRSLDEELRLAR